MKIVTGVLALLLSSILATSAQAGQVCYVPMGGTAMTMCTPEFDMDGNLLSPCTQMLGKFQLVMKKVSDGPGKRRLRLYGPLHGEVNPDQTLNHIMGDNHARGLIYSFGDTLVEAVPLDECLMQVKEELYISLGTGRFSGANGKITVIGELNMCTGVNEFTMEINDDQVCFDQTNPDPRKDD